MSTRTSVRLALVAWVLTGGHAVAEPVGLKLTVGGGYGLGRPADDHAQEPSLGGAAGVMFCVEPAGRWSYCARGLTEGEILGQGRALEVSGLGAYRGGLGGAKVYLGAGAGVVRTRFQRSNLEIVEATQPGLAFLLGIETMPPGRFQAGVHLTGNLNSSRPVVAGLLVLNVAVELGD